MGIAELFILAVGLSMDAFAVSVCKGLSAGRVTLGHALTAGLWFGGFQALMPFLGWLLGVQFQSVITSIDHWIAFVLLGLIGANMIRESRSTEAEEMEVSFGAKAMFPLAVATSIDALTVGITFAFLSAPIAPAVTLIGIITCVLSAFGVKAGGVVGERGKSWAELAGGVVLILGEGPAGRSIAKGFHQIERDRTWVRSRSVFCQTSTLIILTSFIIFLPSVLDIAGAA